MDAAVIFHLAWILLFTCVTASVSGNACYFDHCQNPTDSVPMSGMGCSLKLIQAGKDCRDFKSGSSRYVVSSENSPQFSLSARIKDFGGSRGKATTISLTILNINFDGLIIHAQNLANKTQDVCKHIEFYGNEKNPAPTELYLSCPFPCDDYGTQDYKLQILVTGSTYEYVKQYLLKVPDRQFYDKDVSINDYMPFAYIDISEPSVPSLNVQLHPKRYNVTRYRIWLVNNVTDFATTVDVNVDSTHRENVVSYSFSVVSGSYYFKVAAIHPECGINGCANSTTPVVIINESSYHVLIMVVSTIWIPPAAAYALYRVCKHFKKKRAKSNREKVCLLVYAPTHQAHTTVVRELAKYLRESNVNATTLEASDVPDPTGKDLVASSRDAFAKAHWILIVTSPPSKEATDCCALRDVLRVLKEDYSNKHKNCFWIHPPYCRSEDMLIEVRTYRGYHLPEQVSALVEFVRNGPWTASRYPKYSLPPDKELLDCIKMAEREILKDANLSYQADETDGLLNSKENRNIATDNTENA